MYPQIVWKSFLEKKKERERDLNSSLRREITWTIREEGAGKRKDIRVEEEQTQRVSMAGMGDNLLLKIHFKDQC